MSLPFLDDETKSENDSHQESIKGIWSLRFCLSLSLSLSLRNIDRELHENPLGAAAFLHDDEDGNDGDLDAKV